MSAFNVASNMKKYIAIIYILLSIDALMFVLERFKWWTVLPGGVNVQRSIIRCFAVANSNFLSELHSNLCIKKIHTMNQQLIDYFANLKITVSADGIREDATAQLVQVNEHFTRLLEDYATLSPEQQADETVKKLFYQGQANFHFTANLLIEQLNPMTTESVNIHSTCSCIGLCPFMP